MIFCPKCKSESILNENNGPSKCELIMSEAMSIPLQMYNCNNKDCKLLFLIDSSHHKPFYRILP